MTNKEIIAVVEAAERGEVIQYKNHGESESKWRACGTPIWAFSECDYRVKPKPREIFVNEYKDHLGDMINKTREDADNAACMDRIRVIRFVEADPQ